MKKRIFTGIVIAFIGIPLLLVDCLFPLLQCVIILFSVVATMEMIQMCERKKKIPLGVKIIIILSTILIYLGIVNEDPSCGRSLITQLMNKIDFKVNIITTLTIACAAIFSCQVFVKDFDATDVGKCFMIVLYVAFTDIFALVFGMKFGKHKLCPHISPKKTWEGAIGGTICATIMGSMFAIFYNYFGHYFVPDKEPIKFFFGVFDYEKMPAALMVIVLIVLTALISVSSQIGDLICSKFKRTYEIKDFSQVFPGHGGILDRFDSVLFASIVFLCFITVIRVALPLMGMSV